MARLVKLYDEKQLLLVLQADTLVLIQGCRTIEPVKRLVTCHEVLQLTFDIQLKYPREAPADLECDEGALLHLKTLTQELCVSYRMELPNPGFDSFSANIRKLLRVFRVPKGRVEDVRLEDGSGIGEAAPAHLSSLYVLAQRDPGPGTTT